MIKEQFVSKLACIQVDQLSKSYGKQKVLNKISLHINQGEIHGILGRNGVGKTTLIESIIGLRQPDEGRVLIFGRDIKADRNEIISKIGVQPQESNLFPRQTIFEILRLFSSLYKEPRNLELLIDKMDMKKIQNKKVKDLSVGQRQRLLVALSLVGSPNLIILDEPTSGLDPQTRHLIWEVIRVAKSKQKTVMLSTHHMEEAEKLCDRVSILHNCKIVVSGTPKEIIRNYRKRMNDSLEDVFLQLTDNTLRNEVD